MRKLVIFFEFMLCITIYGETSPLIISSPVQVNGYDSFDQDSEIYNLIKNTTPIKEEDVFSVDDGICTNILSLDDERFLIEICNSDYQQIHYSGIESVYINKGDTIIKGQLIGKATQKNNEIVPVFMFIAMEDYQLIETVQNNQICFDIPKNTPVYSVCDGNVDVNIDLAEYGLFVKVSQEEWSFIFMNLQSPRVLRNYDVKQGQVVGMSGMTGMTRKPVLNLKLMSDSKECLFIFVILN